MKIYSSRSTPSVNVSSLSHRQWLFSLQKIKKKKKKNAFILLLKEETSRFDKNLYLCVESLKNLCAKGRSVRFL